MRPETELWIFAAGEVTGHSPSTSPSSSLSSNDEPDFCQDCKNAVLELLDYMSTLPQPPLHPDNLPALELAKQHEKEYPETGPQAQYPSSPGLYMRHLLLPHVVTLGACHHKVVDICAEAGLVRQEFPDPHALLSKFLFKVSDLLQTRELPKGLRWGEMKDSDIPVVQARTSIPRTTRTLLSLKSVGVFDETETAIAWAFLGLDGSLTTLHTETEYRGKGIAKAVAVKIFREHAPALAVDRHGNSWAHADVYMGNLQSETVCKSLGGQPMVKIYWVRIDLDKAGALATKS